MTALDRVDTRRDELVERLLNGDRMVLARARAWALRIVRSSGYYIPVEDREDVIQETLADVWQQLSRPDFVLRKDFDAFVRTVAYRRCADWMRRHRRTEPVDESFADGRIDPAERLMDAELRELALTVLSRLRESCRTLIRYHALEGLPYSEIARITGEKEGALRTRMYRCLGEARRQFEQLQQGSPGRRSDDTRR